MKLLLFSDLHCDAHAARRLVRTVTDQQIDVVVGAGDFANMRRGLKVTLDVLRAIECPTVVVPGNGESAEELSAACTDWPSAHVLHGSGVDILGISFFGIGGGIPVTPFGEWSYDFSEDEAELLLRDCPSEGILVSHSPPSGILDRGSRGQNLGSTAVLRTVERCRPQLVVCGHIHDCWGMQQIFGQSVIVNAGPSGVVWNRESSHFGPAIE